MEEADRKFAELVLNRLFKDSSVNGLRFFTPQLLLDGPKDIRQDGYINLTSEWEVFESVPAKYPESFKEISQEQEELEIHKLRGEEVEKVEVLSPWPHLVVHFKSGKVLYLNGKDEQYEPWTAGLTNFGNDSDQWLVVACPGGGLAVWAPEGWNNNENV
jgi:methionyl-tRNA formyltransferase